MLHKPDLQRCQDRLKENLIANLSKEDGNIITRIFGKRDKDKEKKKEFGKKEKKGIL
jgi:hypothetical protein